MDYFRLISVLFACTSIIACDDDIDSNLLSTDSFVANFHVTNGGTGITAVEAQLRDITTSSYIDLKDGDRLLSSTVGPADSVTIGDDLFTNLVESAGQVRLMTGSFSNANFPSALLTFTDEVSGSLYEDNNTDNTVYTISLERPVGISAPDSNVALPLDFSIIAPQSNMIFSRSGNIVVGWDTIDNTTSLNITAALNCTNGYIDEFSDPIPVDTGSYTIPANTFSTSSADCILRIVLDRYQTGTIDPHYAPGSQITGHQKRYVEVTSVL